MIHGTKDELMSFVAVENVCMQATALGTPRKSFTCQRE